MTAQLVPTIKSLSQTRVPAISAPVVVPPTNADHPQLVPADRSNLSTADRTTIEHLTASHTRTRTGHGDRSGKPSKGIDAARAATIFVRWAADHNLSREWTADEVWYLASEDFAPAHDLTLPPRRVFLGALQRQPGVNVVYDRRIYGREGRVRAKTTFYALPRDSAAKTTESAFSLAIVV